MLPSCSAFSTAERENEDVDQENVAAVSHDDHTLAKRIAGPPGPETTRRAGLLKGRVSWEAGAFAPMTDAEVAEFFGDAESESQWVVKL